MGNKNLRKAKNKKNDEFYTQYADIKREVDNYWGQLRDKIIYCNTDSYTSSNFVKYFLDNFDKMGLKKLVSLDLEGKYFEYNGTNEFCHVFENGDFRSEHSIEILNGVDIVITNPPFSLFREYVEQLMEYDKDFLIIGNYNAVTYKEIFPLFQENKMWTGFSPRSMGFETSSGEIKSVNASWFTNLDISKRHENLILYKKYDEEYYPTYDNYDAIEVGKVSEIPLDYEGIMGVPITFLDKYNPDQFEILGVTDRHNSSGLKTKTYTEKDCKNYSDLNRRSVTINPDGTFKHYYARILIKNKHPEIYEEE